MTGTCTARDACENKSSRIRDLAKRLESKSGKALRIGEAAGEEYTAPTGEHSYCFSYTATLLNFLPFEFLPLVVTIQRSPSAETTTRPLAMSISGFARLTLARGQEVQAAQSVSGAQSLPRATNRQTWRQKATSFALSAIWRSQRPILRVLGQESSWASVASGRGREIIRPFNPTRILSRDLSAGSCRGGT